MGLAACAYFLSISAAAHLMKSPAMRTVEPKWLPAIDASRCTGCGWCVAACPEHVLALERSGWRKTSVLLDASACTGCRKCEVRCPFHVISMVRVARSGH
jgi:ferredoxin